jgi:hypothetical protein
VKNRLGCGVRGIGTRKVRTVAQRGAPKVSHDDDYWRETLRIPPGIAASVEGSGRVRQAVVRQIAANKATWNKLAGKQKRDRKAQRASIALVMAQPSPKRVRARMARREAERMAA